MILERVRPERLELLLQLLAQRRGEAARDANMMQLSLRVVETEEQGPDAALLVRSAAGDHAVGGTLVLHLAHHPLALDVRTVEGLRHDAVEAGSLEVLEPPFSDG